MVFLFVLITVALIGLRLLRQSKPPVKSIAAPTTSQTAAAAEHTNDAAPAVQQPPKRPSQNPFWPTIYDRETARSTARQAAVAAFFCAAATGLMAFVAYAGLPLAPGTAGKALIDAAIFAALGLGIAKMSRMAAVIALALYVLERIYGCIRVGLPGVLATVVMLVLILCFINGVRGTAAHERFDEPSTGGLPE